MELIYLRTLQLSHRSSVSAALQKKLEDVVRSREDVGRPRSRHTVPSAPMGYHTNSLARVPDHHDDSTTIVFQFRDEKVPYRTKLPSKTPTLKMFKDVLHRKGAFRWVFVPQIYSTSTSNFEQIKNHSPHRYFFRVPCQEMGAVQEEFKNDDDVLPLFEGKVMCSLTPLQGWTRHSCLLSLLITINTGMKHVQHDFAPTN